MAGFFISASNFEIQPFLVSLGFIILNLIISFLLVYYQAIPVRNMVTSTWRPGQL